MNIWMASKKRVIKVVLKPAEDSPTERYVATSPNLRGLATQGRGVDDTIENVKDAIEALFKGKPPEYTLEVKVLVPV